MRSRSAGPHPGVQGQIRTMQPSRLRAVTMGWVKGTKVWEGGLGFDLDSSSTGFGCSYAPPSRRLKGVEDNYFSCLSTRL